MRIRKGNKIITTPKHPALVKYNKRLLDRKKSRTNKIIGLDWLQLAFFGETDENSPLYTLMNKRSFYEDYMIEVGLFAFVSNNKTGQFEFAVNVFYENRLMGVLYFWPKKKYWRHDLLHFKMDNEALYNSNIHPTEFLKGMQKTLNIEYSHVIRLDIYIDFLRFNQRTTVKSLAKNIYSGAVRKVGRQGKLHQHQGYERNTTQEVDTVNFYSSDRTQDGLTIGSRTSGKYIRIYNKSKEKKANPKPYIDAHWAANGLSQSSDVYRFEVELKSDFFRNLDGDYSIEQLFDQDFHVSLLEFSCRKHFEFVFYDKGQKRIDRMKPYELFDFKEMGLLPEFVYRLKRKKKVTEFVSRKSVMQSVRMAMLHYVKSGQSVGWLKYAYNMALRYGLVHEMDKKLEYWFKSFYDQLPSHFEFNVDQFEKDYYEASKLGGGIRVG